MPLLNRFAATRALLRIWHDARRAPVPAQPRASAWVGGVEIAAPPTPSRPTTFELEPELRSVLRAATGPTRTPRLEFAVQPRLTLTADRAAFGHVLAGLIRHAGAEAPAGRVLVTAARSGAWIELGVSDDGIGADRRARQDALRPIEWLIARHGATLEIESWPDQGTSVVMRWPAAAPAAAEPGRASLSVPEPTVTR